MSISYIKAVYCSLKNNCTPHKNKLLLKEELNYEENYGNRCSWTNRF